MMVSDRSISDSTDSSNIRRGNIYIAIGIGSRIDQYRGQKRGFMQTVALGK